MRLLIFLSVWLLAACSPPARLAAINTAVNAHPYIVGEWQCVQYVNEKAKRVLVLGVAPGNIAIVYGTWHTQQHVVLQVRWWGHLWYLDNLNPDVTEEPGLVIIKVFERTKW